MYTPEQFARRPAIAQTEADLMRWLRSLPVEDRLSFVSTLWPLNCDFALVLVRRTQLPVSAVILLLKEWLRLGQHNAADRLIAHLIPVLGEKRFWATVLEVDLNPAMAQFLNYHSHGRLDRELSKAKNDV